MCRARNLRAMEKAKALAADVLIFDLEDAVAPDAKRDARIQVVNAVKAGGYGKREIVIRVNGLNTPWGYADLVAAGTAGADAVLLPKTENVESVAARWRAWRSLARSDVPMRAIDPRARSAIASASRSRGIMHQRDRRASLAAITVCAWRTDSTFSVLGSKTASAPAVPAATRSA